MIVILVFRRKELEMETAEIVVIGATILGLVSRVFVPWMIERIRRPDDPALKWAWRYVWPQLLSVVVLVLVAPLVVSNIEQVLTMGVVAAYVFGWGAADIGKTLFLDGSDAVRKIRNGD